MRLEDTVKLEFVDPNEAIHTCAWCGKDIPEDSEIFSLGAKARKEVHLERQAGRAILIYLITATKRIPAIIPTNDSDAKKQGNDLLFAICSETCGNTLKKTLQAEKNILDSFN